MPDPITGLIKLVAALLDDRKLRKRFNEDAELVAEEFRLTPDERRILFTMDRLQVANGVGAAVQDFLTEIRGKQPDQREFPPCGEEWMEELEEGRAEYPSPVPKITRVRPLEVSLADLPYPQPQDKKFVLTIYGQSFRPDPDLAVTVTHLDSNPNQSWSLTSRLTGTLRCSRLMAVMTRPSGGTGIPTGRYKVVVRNNGIDLPQTGEPDRVFKVKL